MTSGYPRSRVTITAGVCTARQWLKDNDQLEPVVLKPTVKYKSPVAYTSQEIQRVSKSSECRLHT